jgi:geranylgeranyl pyrophosphate synthase
MASVKQEIRSRREELAEELAALVRRALSVLEEDMEAAVAAGGWRRRQMAALAVLRFAAATGAVQVPPTDPIDRMLQGYE